MILLLRHHGGCRSDAVTTGQRCFIIPAVFDGDCLMQHIVALPLLAIPALAKEPQVHRDIAYAEPRNERQTVGVYKLDEPTKALFEFVDGSLRENQPAIIRAGN